MEGCGRLQTRRKEKKNSKRGCPWLPQLPPTWAKPGKSVPRHRAIEEAPQGVVADRDGTCDGDIPPAAPTRTRENYQVGAVGVHRRGHAGQRAEAWCHNFALMTTKMTSSSCVAARRGETGRFAPLLLPAV